MSLAIGKTGRYAPDWMWWVLLVVFGAGFCGSVWWYNEEKRNLEEWVKITREKLGVKNPKDDSLYGYHKRQPIWAILGMIVYGGFFLMSIGFVIGLFNR